MDVDSMSEELLEYILQGGFVELLKHFQAAAVPPEQLDVLWADGWRHFSGDFFRSMIDEQGGIFTRITPLRVDMTRFLPNKRHRRIIRHNADTRVVFEPVNISEAHEALFYEHRSRFRHSIPDSLYTFLSDARASVPCESHQCCVFKDERLIATSFCDIGATALSSLYAMFDPQESARSLGIFTQLLEFEYAQQLGKRHVYLGYAHPEGTKSSAYAYKRQFCGTEEYDWHGTWKALPH